MKPEYLIGWPHTFLQALSCIEASDIDGPSVTALYTGDHGLTDAELGSDFLLALER